MGGISLQQAILTDRGLQYDRRWMLIDESNKFLSQRTLAAMALFTVSVTNKVLQVRYIPKNEEISIALQPLNPQTIKATIWDDVCDVQLVDERADEWFTVRLGMRCRLVYMPDFSERLVEQDYRHNNDLTSLSDGYAALLVGEASLKELNRRLSQPLPMDRFRPNIVFTGAAPHEEDTFAHVKIGSYELFGIKPCARCTVTTINQQTAQKGTEPLVTMAGYRKLKNNIYFGQNLSMKGGGIIKVGQQLEVLERRQSILPTPVKNA